MTGGNSDATCAACGAQRPVAPGPCPKCGGTKRDITLDAEPGSLEISGRPARLVRLRQWVETNWGWLLTTAALSAAGFLLGGIVGLLLGAATVPVGAGAFEKVREIDRQ